MSSDDKLIIETPEQTVLEFPLAGIGSRALALTIDVLVQLAVLLVAGLLAGLIAYAGFVHELGKQWGYAIMIAVAFVTQFGYFAFFETIWNGQTPGKRWTHLRVITDSGRPVDAQGAILRNLLRIIDALPSLYAIRVVTSLISAQNKRVGDYLAGTVVVHEKALDDGRSLWQQREVQPGNATQLRPLAAAEIEIIETFLERRNGLPDDVRRSMALQIAERLSRRWSVPQETIQDPEKFLESVAENQRNMVHFSSELKGHGTPAS